MLIFIVVSLLFCLAQDLLPGALGFFVEMETSAAILALGIFVLIVFRVWCVAPVESLRPASQ
jgi:hypothetical protein